MKHNAIILVTVFLLKINTTYAADEHMMPSPPNKEMNSQVVNESQQNQNIENGNKQQNPTNEKTNPHDFSVIQSLNEQIASLSDQIVQQQTGLETDLQQLLEQRRSVIYLEQKVVKMISEQEEQLEAQQIAIDDVEKRLNEHKEKFAQHFHLLEQLRDSMKTNSNSTMDGPNRPASVDNVSVQDRDESSSDQKQSITR